MVTILASTQAKYAAVDQSATTLALESKSPALPVLPGRNSGLVQTRCDWAKTHRALKFLNSFRNQTPQKTVRFISKPCLALLGEAPGFLTETLRFRGNSFVGLGTFCQLEVIAAKNSRQTQRHVLRCARASAAICTDFLLL